MADLSGTWLGTYWQMGFPTRFEATLIQSGNSLSGSILDDGDLGEAMASGEVIGRNVQFTKHYLNQPQYTISYTGTLSENEDFMQGQWHIGWLESGRWEARRSGENLMIELQTRQEQLVSIGVSQD